MKKLRGLLDFYRHHKPIGLMQKCDLYTLTLPVIGYQQVDEFSCGYICSLMVLHTFYPDTSSYLLYRDLKTSEDGGTSQTAIIRALRKRKISVGVHLQDLDYAGIVRAIVRGKLIITAVDGGDHWVVLYGAGGYPERKVYVANIKGPGWEYFQRNEVRWSRFERLWFKGYGLVCSK